MLTGHKNAYDCIKAFSETDFTEDLKQFDVPTLIVHGDDDQVVPIGASALRAVEPVPHATLKVYPGGTYALADTSKEQLNADLLACIRGEAQRRCAARVATGRLCGDIAPIGRIGAPTRSETSQRAREPARTTPGRFFTIVRASDL